MSLPPNQFNNAQGPPMMTPMMSTGQQSYNQQPMFTGKPPNQANYPGMNHDTNSNSPIPNQTSFSPNNMQNNFNQSASGSPAFNRPSPMPQSGMPPIKQVPMPMPGSGMFPPPSSISNSALSSAQIPTNLPTNAEKVNHITPPLNTPNSLNQLNGPSVSSPPMLNAGFAPYNNQNNQPSSGVLPPISSSYLPPGAAMSGVSQANLPVSTQQIFQKPPGPPPSSQPNAFVGSPMTGSLRNSPLVTGPPTSAPYGQHKPVGINGAGSFSPTPIVSQPQGLQSGPPKAIGQSLPPTGPNAVPQSKPPLGVPAGLSAQPLQAGPMNQAAAVPRPPSMGPPINNQPSVPAINSHFPPQSAPLNSGHQFYPPSSQATPPPPPTQFNPGPPLGPNAFPSSQPPSQPPTSMYQGPSTIGQMMPPSSTMPPGSQSFQSSAVQSGPNIGPHGHQQNALIGQPGPPSSSALGPHSLPTGHQTRPLGPPVGPPSLQSGPPSLQSGPPSYQAGPPMGTTGLQSGPPGVQMGPTGPQTRPPGHLGLQSGPTGHLTGPSGLQSAPPGLASGPPSGFPSGPPGLQTGPSGIQPGPPSGPPGVQSGPSNMQNRYPQMPPGNYNQQGAPPNPGYQQQYKAQGITQQMGNLSVTNQGFDQLWGHQDVDLMQCKNVLPEYPEEPPEIRLGPQFADAPNCSPDIFRCTVNRIPETNSLLQKARLPLGIVIHPFKDLNHLPVIQCSTIVRCRACRTYINPFVYFVDSKRWKCNLCFRVNDLPQEFQYDPVSKSYGDPSRRPEVRSATIEFIAPGEYMLRPPQPAVYLFLFDVSHLARESGYLEVVCSQLRSSLGQLPGDGRTQVAFICYDASVHFYLMADGLTRPKEMTVMDLDDVFLPSPEALLVNLSEQRALVEELLSSLPRRATGPGSPACALGAALQAAYKLAAPTGGRITVFQTCLPNVGPGALQSREDPNARSAKDVAHLSPATDFYKRLALECSGAQVAVDLFLLNSQYADLATLSGMSKFSAGSVYHIPLFKASRPHLADRLRRVLARYLTRKIGFEAVMRVRCTRGVSIHTFHGNFFVRSTDLLSLPNVSPDNAFAMQLAVDESLADLQQVCFQAALLYTSSKGERRIRVHTLALPVASNLTDVLHSADQDCIITLLAKMAVDRAVSSSLSEAKEALSNVAVDVLAAHRLAARAPNTGLACPRNLRLLPTYILAALKSVSFRTGTSTRLDDRVYHMCQLKSLAPSACVRALHAGLYEVSRLSAEPDADPPQLPLSAESIDSRCAYLLDTGDTYIIFVCHAVSPAFLQETFGVTAFTQLQDEARTLPRLEDDTNQLLHLFIEKLNEERPYDADILVLRDNSPSRRLFYDCLINDRLESAFSYYEFLQHIKNQVK